MIKSDVLISNKEQDVYSSKKLGIHYYPNGITKYSLNNAVREYYVTEELYSKGLATDDELRFYLLKLMANRYRVTGETVEEIISVFTNVVDTDINNQATKKELHNYILSDTNELAYRSNILIDHYHSGLDLNLKFVYDYMSKIRKPDRVKKVLLVEMLSSRRLSYPIIADKLGVSLISIKVFFKQNKEFAMLLKCYNSLLSFHSSVYKSRAVDYFSKNAILGKDEVLVGYINSAIETNNIIPALNLIKAKMFNLVND